jgi:CubicO group peptidase (beta-lactamase class C family)
MFKSILIFTACILLLVSCASTKTTANVEQTTQHDSLTIALNNFAKNSLIPGFSVAIVDENELGFAKGFGFANIKTKTPFTTNTIHQVASISKTFIGFCIMKLVEDGKLNLNESISSILTYKITNPHFPTNPITVRQLVTPTSSILDFFEPYYVGEADTWLVEEVDKKDYPEYMLPNIEYYKTGKPISLEESIRKFSQPKAKWYSDSTFLQKAPGTHYQYSNLGAVIAALIVEVKSGISFVNHTKKYIFEPLKMKNTGWKFEDFNATNISKNYAFNSQEKPTSVAEYPQVYSAGYPAGGLLTSAIDMGNYLQEMIRGSMGKGKLLSSSSYKTLFAAQLPINMVQIEDQMGKINNMGIFWFLSKDCVSHIGGNDGVYSFLYFNPITKRGAFAHTNLRDNSFGEILSIVRKYEEKNNSNSNR